MCGILNLDTEALKKDKAKMKALSTFISDPDFAFENINKSSKACGPLVQWAIAQYKFATILGSIDPLRQEVYQLQEAGRASEEQLALLTTQVSPIHQSLCRSPHPFSDFRHDLIEADSDNVRSMAGADSDNLSGRA